MATRKLVSLEEGAGKGERKRGGGRRVAKNQGQAVAQVKPCGLRSCLEPALGVSARVSGGREAKLGGLGRFLAAPR